jgi:hypothetical protein
MLLQLPREAYTGLGSGEGLVCSVEKSDECCDAAPALLFWRETAMFESERKLPRSPQLTPLQQLSHHVPYAVVYFA